MISPVFDLSATFRRVLLCGSLAAAGGLPAAPAPGRTSSEDSRIVLNERLLARQHPVFPRSYDSHPAFVEASGDAAGYAVWHAYAPGAERIIGNLLETSKIQTALRTEWCAT